MRYVIYTDRAGEFRWQLLAANNQVIADSGEGYTTKASCQHGISLNKASSTAPVYDRS